MSNPPFTPFRLGVRAHDLGRFPADELARRVRAEGLECVQLALGKAIEGVDLVSGKLERQMVAEVSAAFSKHEVRIEVLGCYINPIHPDAATRTALLGLFKEHLRHAREFGCNLVALESGSPNADQSYHVGNGEESVYQDLLGSMRELVEEAERCGVVVGIEAVTSHVLSTPERLCRLLKDIPSVHLQVVFDPVNLLTPSNYSEQRKVMRRSFDLFGDRIAVVHVKDFNLEDGCLVTCSPGSGLLDYEYLLSLLAHHQPDIAILLEGVSGDRASSCARFIRSQSLTPIL